MKHYCSVTQEINLTRETTYHRLEAKKALIGTTHVIYLQNKKFTPEEKIMEIRRKDLPVAEDSTLISPYSCPLHVPPIISLHVN